MIFDGDTLAAVLRSDFAAFIEKCFATLMPTERYQDNWHIHAMAWELEQVRRGHMRRLIINMPPRMMKSLIVSIIYPAWILGHMPGKRIIVASYAEDLARTFSRQTRIIMESAWYRKLFPATKLSRLKQTETDITTTKGGGRIAFSLGGSITGRGGNIIILDDPAKVDDAMSEAERKRVNRLFFNSFFLRTDDMLRDSIILVGQRLHVDDLFGHVLRKTTGWRHITLAAVARQNEKHRIGPRRFHKRKAGELLHPARMTLAYLEERKRALGTAHYSAHYDQDPQPHEGALLKRAWFERYQRTPERDQLLQVVMSADTATKIGDSNSYSVITVWGITHTHYYLLQVWRERVEFPQLCQAVRDLADAWNPDQVLIEDASSGQALFQALTQNTLLNLLPIKPDTDKETRVWRHTATLEAKRVLLPADAPWLPEFESELFSFPNSPFDDQVDSMTQFLAYARDHAIDCEVINPVILEKDEPGLGSLSWFAR